MNKYVKDPIKQELDNYFDPDKGNWNSNLREELIKKNSDILVKSVKPNYRDILNNWKKQLKNIKENRERARWI
jgi:hypothetical protein